jgi:hypothetical protein
MNKPNYKIGIYLFNSIQFFLNQNYLKDFNLKSKSIFD